MVLKGINIEVGYSKQVILSNVNFNVSSGQLVALLGLNGSGKSTLLYSIGGLLSLIKGSCLWNEESISSWNIAQRAKKIAVVTTHQLNSAHLTAFDVAAMGRYPHTGVFGQLTSVDREIVENALLKCGLKDLFEKEYASMSDGERQRVLIARALSQQTELIILDEPTSFLDVRGKSEVFELLFALSKELLVIYSTHELELAINTATHFWLIDENKSFYSKSKIQLAEEQLLEKIFYKSIQ